MDDVEILEAHLPLAGAAAARFAPPGPDRDDLRQVALIAVWRAIRHWQPGKGGFGLFASRRVRWALLKALAARRRQPGIEALPLDLAAGAGLNGERQTAIRDMLAAVEDLGERQRRVVELRFGLDGQGPMTLREAAGVLGISRQRVGELQARALAELRKALGRGGS